MILIILLVKKKVIRLTNQKEKGKYELSKLLSDNEQNMILHLIAMPPMKGLDVPSLW